MPSSRRSVRPRTRVRRYRPRLERLEERIVPTGGALRDVSDASVFSLTTLARSDDGSSGQVDLGFSINYFGTSYDQAYVNNNGNVTFGGESSTYSADSLSGLDYDLLAPYFGDVDTRPDAGGSVSYATGSIDGHDAFVVTWQDVGYYNQKTDKLNTFQLVLIAREDLAAGDFDVEFNYAQIQWDHSSTNSGYTRAGWADNGNADNTYELPGSGSSGGFLDNGNTPLIERSLNSSTQGRLVFYARDGILGASASPELDDIAGQTVRRGDTFTITASATDPDTDSADLRYSLVAGPSDAVIDETTGVIKWMPGANEALGDYTFTVTVKDNGSPQRSDTESFVVNVLNASPALEKIADQTAIAGETFSVTATATDLDTADNALTYSLVSAPKGADINSATGVITWTPAADQAPGKYSFKVQVADDSNPALTDTTSFDVLVYRKPVLDAIANQEVVAGEKFSYTVTATDADSSPKELTYSLLNAPKGAEIDSSTGVLTWTPAGDIAPGDYSFTVQVADSTSPALTDKATFLVTVLRKPELDAVSNQSFKEGTSFSYTVTASDADTPSSGLTYTLVSAPKGASIDGSTGTITWTPLSTQTPGDYTFKVQVSDTTNLTDSEAFTVSIINVDPTVVLDTPVVPLVGVGDTWTLGGSVADPGGVSSLVVFVNYNDGSNAQMVTVAADGSFTLSHIFIAQSNYTVTVTVADPSGGSDQAETDVNVLPAGSAGKVVAYTIVTAEPGEFVSADLNLTGGAVGTIDFLHSDGSLSEASVFFASYSDNPLNTARTGTFFDIQVKDTSPDDQLTLTFQLASLPPDFEFGYFPANAPTTWVSLRDRPDLVTITYDQTAGTMTVKFLTTTFLNGTVFAVTLPTASTTTTAVANSPTADAGKPASVPSSDVGGTTRTATFSNNTQVSLVLTASRDSQAGVNASAQGNGQNAQANLGTTAQFAGQTTSLASSGGGDNTETEASDEDSPFWRWLPGEEDGQKEGRAEKAEAATTAEQSEDIAFSFPLDLVAADLPAPEETLATAEQVDEVFIAQPDAPAPEVVKDEQPMPLNALVLGAMVAPLARPRERRRARRPGQDR